MAAFRWLVGVLETQGIPFAITGGLAARSYGSPRELYDIDLDVPDDCLPRLAAAVAPQIVFGPHRFQDAEFDLLLLTLRYAGQDIDRCGADSGKIRDRQTDAWVECPSALAGAEPREVLGIIVPVINKASLIAYKKCLARDTDLLDVAALESEAEPPAPG